MAEDTRCTATISMSEGGGLYERPTKDGKLLSKPWIHWNEGELVWLTWRLKRQFRRRTCFPWS